MSSSQQRNTDEPETCLPEARRAREIHQATLEACSRKFSSIATDSGDSVKTSHQKEPPELLP